MANQHKIHPVILCGGHGSRLWPLSNEAQPKQFLKILSDKTLLQETLLRVANTSLFYNPILVCNEKYKELAFEQSCQIGREPKALILEPMGKNTAPAIALAALHLQSKDNDAIIAVMPSDHVIENTDQFQKNLSQAAELAANGHIVTLGITPTHPTSLYGYITAGDEIENSGFGHKIKEFVEKPPTETAEKMIAAGNCFWNGGIFVMRCSTYLEELKAYAPDVLRVCEASLQNGTTDQSFIHPNAENFNQNSGISIDHAVMEHSDKGVIIPLSTEWDDIGSWASIWDQSEKDENGVVRKGDVVAENTQDAYLHATSRKLAVAGVKDIIVIETKDQVLVISKDELHHMQGLYKKSND